MPGALPIISHFMILLELTDNVVNFLRYSIHILSTIIKILLQWSGHMASDNIITVLFQ